MRVKKLIFYFNGSTQVSVSKIYSGLSPLAGASYFWLNGLTAQEKGIIITKQKHDG